MLFSVTNIKYQTNIICHSLFFLCYRFTMLQLLSPTKQYFIQIFIIHDNISSQVDDKRR